MNQEQLQKLRELIEGHGYKFNAIEQRITNFDNKNKGEFVITFQARFDYCDKLTVVEK